MVDCAEHLDVVDQALGDGHAEVRVCLELDVSWRPLAGQPLVHIGTRRSPLYTPRQAADFARAVTPGGRGFRLMGVMGYEGQIAGLGDAPPGHPVPTRLIRGIQDHSAVELRQRRTAAVRLIQALVSLEFVNGGGTGSLESTALDESVTELTADLAGRADRSADVRLAVDLGPVELGTKEGRLVLRVRHVVPVPAVPGELRPAPLGDRLGQPRLDVVGEVLPRGIGSPFLAHEQHRRVRPGEHEAGADLDQVPGRHQGRDPVAGGPVPDLVVVLQVAQEPVGGNRNTSTCRPCVRPRKADQLPSWKNTLV